MGHDDRRYPFERIFATAELASSLQPEAAAGNCASALADAGQRRPLLGRAGDPDARPAAVSSGSRIWRKRSRMRHRTCALPRRGRWWNTAAEPRQPGALAVLGEHAPWGRNDVFVSMAALAVIDHLGLKAAGLRGAVKTWPAAGASPDPRFDSLCPAVAEIDRGSFW